jgi:Fe-S cluster biosynthesis and repair protein YggX
LINEDELAKANAELDKWLEKDRKKFAAEQANEKKQPAK